MTRYTFKNGDIVTSNLEINELLKRMKRLDILRVLTEQYECEEGKSICRKTIRAYNKINDFTGIIHLTFLEKDWLSCMLENEFLDNEDREVIKFYCSYR